MDEICAATRAVLQSEAEPLFRKPRLTETLLRRPPFRFVHDIVTAVKAATGFGDDVLDETEVPTEREAKVAFVQKLKDVVASAGEDVDVDAQKVVAGLEPERTNALLQALGRVARRSEPTRRDAQTRPPSRRGTRPLNQRPENDGDPDAEPRHSDAFRRVASLLPSLSATVENLRLALGPMQKDLAVWRSETASYRAQLHSLKANATTRPNDAALRQLEDETAATARRIRALRETTRRKTNVVNAMLCTLSD